MANALLGKIAHEYDLSNMAEVLPAAQQLPFVLANMRNSIDFLFALKLMDSSERLAFAHAHIHLIVYTWEFENIVELLPVADRLSFAMAHSDFFKLNQVFYRVFDFLSPDEALIFATANQEKITNSRFMSYICGKIPVAASDAFLKANIRNTDLLIYLLRITDKADCLALAIKHQHLIKDYSDLYEVLQCLPQDDRLTFAIANQDKPHAAHLVMVSQTLHTKDLLIFANANCENGDDLLDLLGMMFPDLRLACAMKHQDKIKTLACLVSVDKLLEGDKQQFIQETAARIVKMLNPERAIIPRPVSIGQPFTLFGIFQNSLDEIGKKIAENVCSWR
jgi:hypothetical protein